MAITNPVPKILTDQDQDSDDVVEQWSSHLDLDSDNDNDDLEGRSYHFHRMR